MPFPPPNRVKWSRLHAAVAGIAVVLMVVVAVAVVQVAGGSPVAVSPAAGRTPATDSAAAAGAAPAHFGTLSPGSALPSGAQCAAWVRARPLPENRAANTTYNRATGRTLGATFFPASDDPRANSQIAPRVDGQFTGTTYEILRWAACKWGIDEDVVAAQAAVESWWRQSAQGDWGSDQSACAPGHGLSADGKTGQCPQSFGILQNRYRYEQASWPGIAGSTAMNADTAYAIWRTCDDGYELWLNQLDRGRQYAAGDLWGCIGRWFAGRWYTSDAQAYIGKVQSYLNQRVWEQPSFT